MSTSLTTSEKIAHEPGNTRGWPKTKKQLRYALLRVRDGLTPRQALVVVFGEQYSRDSRYSALEKKIAPFIAFLQEKKNEIILRNFEITTERLLREVAAIALADRVSFTRQVIVDGQKRFIGRPPDELDPVQRMAVKSWDEKVIETDDGKVVDYQYVLHDKQSAQTFVGKHLGMLSETLLVEMASRRQAAQVVDYSHLSASELDDAIASLSAIQRRLRPPIDGSAEDVTDAEEEKAANA